MLLYNHRVIGIIRKSLKLTQQDMANMLGVSRACFITYENGRSKGIRDFFFERMIAQFGIDLRSTADPHCITFVDSTRLPPPVYQYLRTLELKET